MLVLTRTAGEAIVIDSEIWVTVLSVQGPRIRLGITAPKSIRIDRGEVHARRTTDDVELHEVEQVS
jgi:carbon storage regulator